MKYKRLEEDNITFVYPEVYLFDTVGYIQESSMPYIQISATEDSGVENNIVNFTIKVVAKNDGIIYNITDDEGNETNEKGIIANDFLAYETALAIGERIELELFDKAILKDNKKFYKQFIENDFTGDGVAILQLKFSVYAPPIINTSINKLFEGGEI